MVKSQVYETTIRTYRQTSDQSPFLVIGRLAGFVRGPLLTRALTGAADTGSSERAYGVADFLITGRVRCCAGARIPGMMGAVLLRKQRHFSSDRSTGMGDRTMAKKAGDGGGERGQEPRGGKPSRSAPPPAVEELELSGMADDEELEAVGRELERGWQHVEAGEITAARKVADTLHAEYPDTPEVLVLLGMVESLEGKPDQALTHYEQASSVDPEYVEPLLCAAELYIWELGEDEKGPGALSARQGSRRRGRGIPRRTPAAGRGRDQPGPRARRAEHAARDPRGRCRAARDALSRPRRPAVPGSTAPRRGRATVQARCRQRNRTTSMPCTAWGCVPKDAGSAIA